MWRDERQDRFLFNDVTTIIIGNDVTEINVQAFSFTSITTITIPEGVTNIRMEAFGNCTNLTSLVIPASVTGIDNFAFELCSNLESITFNSQIPPTLGVNVFAYTDNLATIYVPYGAEEAYEAVEQLNSFTIKEMCEICGKNPCVCPKPNPLDLSNNDDNESNNRGGSSVRDAIISGAGIGGGSGAGSANTKAEPSSSFENQSDTLTKGSGEALTFIIDKNFADFREVRINGRRLTKGTHYTVKSGSTIITLLPEYLDALEAGEHELSVHFSGLAVVRDSFTVEETEFACGTGKPVPYMTIDL
ncbi:MAG: leucine-rich repeat protein [Oscillospiraceae bacterium]|nr:leucine-rich repeat protein [Oscillospiraceae bacterium]